MNLSEACWVATAAYGAHILEEFFLDWRGWVWSVSRVRVGRAAFWSLNALVIAGGAGCALIAGRWPAIALAYPALMLINVTFFHLAPLLRVRSRLSPGLLTGLMMFYPIGISCYWVAGREGLLTRTNLELSTLLAIVAMTVAVVTLKALSFKTNQL